MKLKIPDIFTYEDGLSEKRKTRAYVNVTLFVVAALIIFMALALYQQAQESREMAATKTLALVPTVTPTAEPMVAAEVCPSDPADWTLGDVFENDVRKAITPACVYDGLAHSVAWVLAIQEGYSRQEAAEALGFSGIINSPSERMSEVTVADDQEVHKLVRVHFMPPVANFTEWYFTNDARPAVSFSIRGCFRTFSLIGTLKQEWQEGYSVICELGMDVEAQNMLMCFDDHCYSSPYEPTRYSVLFGYSDDHRWLMLGIENNVRIAIDNAQQFQEDRAAMMLHHGITTSWDAEWLAKTFQIEARPVPVSWQEYTDNDDLIAIINSLNIQLGGGNP